MNIRQGYYNYFKSMIAKKSTIPDIDYDLEGNLILTYKLSKGTAIVQQQAGKVYCRTNEGYVTFINKGTRVRELERLHIKGA